MKDYVWYVVIASTSIFLLVRLIIHLIEFFMFMKIKETLLMELYNILSNSDDNKDMDTNIILELLYSKVDEIKARKYLEEIELSYNINNNMILSLTMDNGKSKPKFDFSVELDDIITIKEIDNVEEG